MCMILLYFILYGNFRIISKNYENRAFCGGFQKWKTTTTAYFSVNFTQWKPNKALASYLSTTGSPLLLGQLDSIVQTYLFAQSQQRCVINTSIANATAHALIKRNLLVAWNIDFSLICHHWIFIFGSNFLPANGISEAPKNFIKSCNSWCS